MKKLILIVSALVLLFAAITAVSAAEGVVTDNADLLAAGEEQTLRDLLEDCSDTTGMDVAVITVASLGGDEIRAYAIDFYETAGYGADGVLLIISMQEREWYILTAGEGKELLNDGELRKMEDAIVEKLSDGAYYEAFCAFETSVRRYANYESPLGWIICIGVGIVVGFIVVLILKGQLKSVRSQRGAANYVVDGSFCLTQSNEFFLYRNVTCVQKASSSSGGSSFSGGSYGGRGGKF